MYNMMNDFKENGVFSEISTRIAVLEKFMRDMQGTDIAPSIDSPCRYYLGADIANIPADVDARINLNTELFDNGDSFTVADWYGTAAAYTQADAAGCNATTIEKAGAGFLTGASLRGSLVLWASDAAGTLNVGSGYVTAVPAATTLTIQKATGADFANNYYFYIKNAFYVVPKAGLYLITSSMRLDTTQDQRRYDLMVYNFTAGYSVLGKEGIRSSGVGPLIMTSSVIYYLAENDYIGLVVMGVSLAAAMTIKGGAATTYATYTSLGLCRIAD